MTAGAPATLREGSWDSADGFDDSVRSRWWDVAFIGVPSLSAGVVLAGGTDLGDLLSVAALAGIVVFWALFRVVQPRSITGARAVEGGIFLLGLLAIAASPNAGSIQALLFPLLWTLSTGYRQAVVTNIAFGIGAFIAFSVGLGSATGDGVNDRTVLAAAGIAGFSLIFSLAFGTWITRISMWGNERSRLLAELTAAQDDLAAAHRESGERTERERMARELHDTLTQSLTGLVMLAQRAKAIASSDSPDAGAVSAQLELIDEVARGALAEARAVVTSAASLQVDGGLTAAMHLLAERVKKETGIRVDATVAAAPGRELEVVLLRCAQEALANVRKHSGASRATLDVEELNGSVHLVVTDDGQGLTPGAPGTSTGFGLAGMRERLALVGGSLDLTSPPSGGTRLSVVIPAPHPRVATTQETTR